MALTIIKNPSHYNFSKSPVMCEIETDNMLISGNFGDKARFIFYVPANPIDLDIIVLSTNYIGLIVFRFTNGTPAPSEWGINLRGGGQTLSSYYNYVLARLQANTSAASRYSITHIGNGGFLFEALNGGVQDSNLSSLVVGTDFLFINLKDGTDNYLTDQPRENYQIVIEIKQETISTFPLSLPAFKTVYTAQKEPYNNRVKFDLSKLLNVGLSYYFPTPNLAAITLCDQVCKKFFVSIKEFYGTPAVEHATTITPTGGLQTGTQDTLPAFLLKAGLSPKWTKYYVENLQILNYIWSNPFFLTTQSSFKKIKINQPEYLYFLLYDDYDSAFPQDLRLKIVTHLDDGTQLSVIALFYNLPFYKGQTFCFPINPSGGEIYIKMLTYDNISKFVVSIVCSHPAATVSPEFTYIPNYDPIGEDRIFLYTNSLGGVDTWRSEGNYENDINFENEVFNRIYFTDDAPHLGMNSQTQTYKQDTFKVFSGWKTQDEIDGFEELFLADYKVELLNTLIYMPIIITSKKYRRHKTNENLKGIEIEYYHQFKSPVTDKLAAPL